ncbi:META domain-containing protein [Phyllobacterium endophyticum]|uniref:META domain-containing protein n=1 Tax=Phyllobacterium endophyticum TaxID=1149773 RepID=UPI0011CA0D74|nr:META domain-containing protein [Phyllobacterium endophyticum]TXR49048.1 META domain-containing protein [Phyllobacterium endophyticum]
MAQFVNRLAIGSLIVGAMAVLVLMVLSFSARGDEPAGEIRNVSWLAEDIDGRGVIDDAQTTLKIDADGSVNGSGGCNRFMSRATIDVQKLTFKPAAATRMMCPPALMDQEQKFFSVMERTRSYAIDAETGKLLLRDETDKTIARLAQKN